MLNFFLKSELYSKNLAYGRHWISRPRGPIQWTLEYKKIWFLTRGGGGFGHYLIILTMGGRWVRPISYFGFKLKSYANIPSIQIDRVEFILMIFWQSFIVSGLLLAVQRKKTSSPLALILSFNANNWAYSGNICKWEIIQMYFFVVNTLIFEKIDWKYRKNTNAVSKQ